MRDTYKSIEIKGKIIGGSNPLICVPIVASNYDELVKESSEVLAAKPDLVEWRVDYYDDVFDKELLLDVLQSLRDKLHEIPLIFTLRLDLEGGVKKIDSQYRIDLIKEAIKSKNIDIVDIELIVGDQIRDIVNLCKENGVYVLVSNHDFEKTPPKKDIIDKFIEAQNMGADIAKVAVMANKKEDALELLYAVNDVREKYTDIPIVGISMSEKGIISRIMGMTYGSAFTFASGRQGSAPGQLSISKMRKLLEIIGDSM